MTAGDLQAVTEAPAWRDLYPFRSHWLEIDAQRVHYLDEGEGPVLLLVHGNPTWSFYWREMVRALRDRYRVVVPDHVGCGLSDKPPEAQYPYRLARRVDDLVRLVEHLCDRGFELLDVQFISPHMQRLGAVEIPRDAYLKRLEQALTREVSW